MTKECRKSRASELWSDEGRRGEKRDDRYGTIHGVPGDFSAPKLPVNRGGGFSLQEHPMCT